MLEENKLGYTVCLDLGLQYQNFSVKLNSGGISRTRSDHSTVPFVGIRAKLTFYDRASVFAEGALFVPELFILFRHLSAGLSCYLTEDLEVSIAYLQQLYGFSGNFDFHPGFKGWSFALTFRI